MSIVSQTCNTRLFGRHKEALDLFSAGNLKDALLILLELADAEPTNHFVCLDLGEVVLRLGMADQAVVAARRAIELDSADCDGFILLSRALDAKGQLRDALVAMARAVDILRDPYRSAEDVAREKLVPPLVLSKPPLAFYNFEILGNAANLALASTSSAAGVSTTIRILLSGALPEAPSGMEEIAAGNVDKSRLCACLPEKQASIPGLFPQESFSYSIYRKKNAEGK
jgi:tetratricopeptide (TPR) repeat protein